MKRCVDTASLDRYEGAALMSLGCFALVGGARKGGRLFNGIRHPWRRAILRTFEGGRMVPDFPGRVSSFSSRHGWVSRVNNSRPPFVF